MIVDPLAVVVLTSRNDVAHVAAFDRGVPVAVHQLIGLVEVPLIVADGGGGLVVHHHLHPLALRVAVDLVDIEVRIGGLKVEDIILGVAEPVLPADVPPFHQHGVEAMLRGKVDIAFHVLRGGTVATVGLHFAVVGDADLHRRQVGGIGPVALAGDHLPPDSHILGGLNPRGVLNL